MIPVAFTDYRVIYNKEVKVPQLLVRWFDSVMEDTTWEDITALNKIYPDLNLEDKVLKEEVRHEATN